LVYAAPSRMICAPPICVPAYSARFRQVTPDDPGGLWRGRKRSKAGTRDASDVALHAGQLTVFVETVRTLVDE
jgi:hypothetical protein